MPSNTLTGPENYRQFDDHTWARILEAAPTDALLHAVFARGYDASLRGALVEVPRIALDRNHAYAAVDGVPIELSQRECEVLEELVRAWPKAVPTRTLHTRVFGSTYDMASLRTYVYYLRKKLGAEAITLVGGGGRWAAYRLNVDGLNVGAASTRRVA